MTLRIARRRSPNTMTSTIKRTLPSAAVALCALFVSAGAFADEPKGEMNLVLPDFKSGRSSLGMTGWNLLAFGLVVCALGLVFGLVIYKQLKKLPVHKSMLEISELIYETCKTYLDHAGASSSCMLEVLHRRDHRRLLRRRCEQGRHRRGRRHPRLQPRRHRRLRRRRVVRHPRQHLRQLAHRVRGAQGQALPHLRDPAQGRHEHRHAAHLDRAPA